MSRPADTYRAARRNRERENRALKFAEGRLYYVKGGDWRRKGSGAIMVKRGFHRIKGKTYGAKPLVQFSSTGDFAIGRTRLGTDTTQ
jgi:hypothetical protein